MSRDQVESLDLTGRRSFALIVLGFFSMCWRCWEVEEPVYERQDLVLGNCRALVILSPVRGFGLGDVVSARFKVVVSAGPKGREGPIRRCRYGCKVREMLLVVRPDQRRG